VIKVTYFEKKYEIELNIMVDFAGKRSFTKLLDDVLNASTDKIR
jgi:hypothetical protein